MSETATSQADFLILLNTVARLIRTHAEQSARLKGMTRAQWGILGSIDRQPGISQNDLACLVEVEPISVGRMIDRLEARGLVERRADPRDRRIHRLHLTAHGMPLLADMHAWKAAITEATVAGVDTEKLRVAEQVLLQMKANLTHERRDGGKADPGIAATSNPPAALAPAE